MIDVIIDFNSSEDKQRLYRLLGELKKVRQSIVIKQVREKRSGNQSRYYQKCIVTELAHHYGWTPKEMHDFLKTKFNPKIRHNTITGEISTTGRSTTELNTKEFEEYCEAIRIWALTEEDFLIKLPNEE